LVFTKDSTAGYKGLFEESALKYDATNNKLTADEVKCNVLHFSDTPNITAKIVSQNLGIDPVSATHSCPPHPSASARPPHS
jgi:hypothetical protein